MSVDERVERMRAELTEMASRSIIGDLSREEQLALLNGRASEQVERLNRMGAGDRIRFYANLFGLDPEKAIVEIADVTFEMIRYAAAERADVETVIEMKVLLRRAVENVVISFTVEPGKA